jgi:hypothetical protein
VNLGVDLMDAKSIIEPDPRETGPLDFSQGPLTFTVTAENGTTREIKVEVHVRPAESSEELKDLDLVSPNGADWLLSARWEEDGSYSTALAAPFVPERAGTVSPYRLYVTLEGLSNVGWSIVSVEGYEENSLLSPEKMLWIGGTAEDRKMLESLSVTQIDFRYEDEPNVEYRQIFDPPVSFYAIGKRYINEPTEPTVIYRSRGGCDAGFGTAAFLLLLSAAAAGARKRF